MYRIVNYYFEPISKTWLSAKWSNKSKNIITINLNSSIQNHKYSSLIFFNSCGFYPYSYFIKHYIFITFNHKTFFIFILTSYILLYFNVSKPFLKNSFFLYTTLLLLVMYKILCEWLMTAWNSTIQPLKHGICFTSWIISLSNHEFIFFDKDYIYVCTSIMYHHIERFITLSCHKHFYSQQHLKEKEYIWGEKMKE